MAQGGSPSRLAMNQVHIDTIAQGGAGVGRLADGMAVFVPRAAPGDVLEVAITRRKKRHAHARLVNLITPSELRVRPRCRHYVADECGGCQLQHLAPEAQQAVKRRLVGDALRRIGRRQVADPEIVSSPNSWRYRTKITLAGDGTHFGLHPLERPGTVFVLEDCLITRESLIAVWRRLAEHVDLFPPDTKTVVLREDQTGRTHVILAGGHGDVWDASPLAKALANPEIVLWWRPPHGAARVMSGPESGFPALAFEQVNSLLAERIRRDAVARLGEIAGRTVWDLYGGVGDTAELLVKHGADAWLVDRDRSAVAWARRRGMSAGRAASRYIAAPAEEALHRLPPPHAVVVNPPREGLHRRVATCLDRWARESAHARLVYVSCDPATLARDLVRMPALHLRSVQAYDLFPQTSHVETVVVLEAA